MTICAQRTEVKRTMVSYIVMFKAAALVTNTSIMQMYSIDSRGKIPHKTYILAI